MLRSSVTIGTMLLPVLLTLGIAPTAEAPGAAFSSMPQTIGRSWLDRFDMKNRPVREVKLPKKISEASGLAMSDDGRLFCHDDEKAVIYQLDERTGRIIKEFQLGARPVYGDFEGIAIKGPTFYLVTSSGNIYEAEEGNDNEGVSYRFYSTYLTEKNDVEGLEYDGTNNCLLLACKGDPVKGYAGYKVVYAFDLRSMTLRDQPQLLISIKAVQADARKGNFAPSGIAWQQRSETFFIISAAGESIIEITREGIVLGQEELPRKVNPHPEGITFAADGTMIICNDGQGDRGSLTFYTLVR
jgi:uncharacterized protein YjiK